MNINIKELCKQIKHASKRNLIWSVSDGFNYISNRHWMVRYDTLPREVLIALFSAFAEIPKDGESFNMSPYLFGDYERKEAMKVDKIYESLKSSKKGEVTPFLKEIGDVDTARIIKSQETLIYINSNYFKLIEDIEASNPLCSGTMQPIFFFGGQLILLPYRITNSKEDEIIEELLSA